MQAERIYKILNEKNAVPRWLARKVFRTAEAFGLHVTGDHFYEPIPNVGTVIRTYDAAPRKCLGLTLDLPSHEALACQILEERLAEFNACGSLRQLGFMPQNPYYHGFDAAVLFGIIRHFRPRRILEIGQGMSTRVAMAAAHANWQDSGTRTSLVTVDPYQRLPDTVRLDGVDVSYQNSSAQTLDPKLIASLQANDLLFVDSSHVFKFGSDVQFEFESIYPILPAGVIVHVHDIFTPFDYPKEWIVDKKMFWNEQYVLEQFLAFNDSFRILLPSHCVTRLSPRVQSAWARLCGDQQSLAWWSAEPHESASSFYMRRV